MSLFYEVWQWFGDPANREGPDGVVARLGEHVQLSIEGLAIGALIALPIGIVLGHFGRFGNLAINVSNAGRAIPSFAVLVIAFQVFGLGNGPIVLALALLAIPPMLTNAYVALREVDPDVKDAARGMGYHELPQIVQIELPLAVPLIMAGIRTAAVQVVATATLAAVIAGGGLGRFIIDGLARNDIPRLVAGALLVAALALATELTLGGIELLLVPKALRRRQVSATVRRVTSAKAA